MSIPLENTHSANQIGADKPSLITGIEELSTTYHYRDLNKQIVFHSQQQDHDGVTLGMIMQTHPEQYNSLLRVVIDTLIDEVSHTPIVFDETLLPDILKSLADSVEVNPMMPLLIRLLRQGASHDEIRFELMGVGEDDHPIIYTYALSRTHSETGMVYVLRLLDEQPEPPEQLEEEHDDDQDD